jgi:hypothetical protein
MWGRRPFLGFVLAACAFAPSAQAAGAPTASMDFTYSSSATDTMVLGSFDGQGQATTYRFGYDLNASAWCTTGGVVGSPAHLTAVTPESTEEPGSAFDFLHMLTAGTRYCVALIATNASGTTTSSTLQFTQGAPAVGTDEALSTSATSSDITGWVYGAGQPTTYHVDWDLKSSAWCMAHGTSGTPAHSTATQALPAPNDETHAVSVALTALTPGTAYCANVAATNGSAGAAGTPVEFVQGQPGAHTFWASSDAATTATVTGEVNPAGQATTYRVAYDLASSAWCSGDGTGTPAHTTSPQALGPTDSAWHEVSVSLTGLTGGTAYCARLTAANGTASSPPEALPVDFTPGLPRAYVDRISPASATSDLVTGWVRTLGQATTYRFAYDVASSSWCSNNGETGTPAHATAPQSVTDDNGASNPVSATITGLTAGTPYCVALVATNGSGSSPNDGVTEFTHGAPIARSSGVHSTSATAAKVTGTVNPAGQSTTYHVAYDLASSDWCQSYGFEGSPAHTTADRTLGFSDVAVHAVDVDLTGLTAGAGYCASLVAHNSAATANTFAWQFRQGVPEAETDVVHPTGPATATVEGSIDPIAQATTYRVDWDLASSDWCQAWGDDSSGSAAHSTPSQPLPFTDTASHAVTVALDGLTAGQEYCAAVVAVNASGTSDTFVQRFTQGTPELTLDDAHSTGLTTAAAAGTVNPAGQATTYHLAYDVDSSDFCLDMGQIGTPAFTTPEVSLPQADTTAHAVTFDLTGLTQHAYYCAVLVATNAAGETRSWAQEFRQGTPSARVSDVHATGGSTATVTGTVNAAGQATTYHVEWDRAGSDWCDSEGWEGVPAHTTAAQSLGFTDGADHAVSVDISGLATRTDHCVALVAENPTGRRSSAPAVFTAGTDAPTVTTLAATALTTTGATLNGTVTPHGTATGYHFEYGTTTAYGTSTPAAGAGAGDSPQTVAATIAGLTAATTYHYRLVADNAGGANAGSDMTFTTPSAASDPPPPSDPPPSDPPPSEDPPHHDPPAPDPPHSDPPHSDPRPSDPPAPTPPGDSGPPTTGSSDPGPAADTTAPRITANLRGVTTRKLLRKKGVAVNVDCDEPSAVTVDLVAPAKLARKLGISPALGTATATVDPSHAARLIARLSARARAKLAHAGTFKLTVVITAKDRGGNRSSTTRTVLVGRG